MIVVTAGFALLSAGVAIVAGAFAALGWPVSLAIIALGAAAAGGDVSLVNRPFFLSDKWGRSPVN